MRHNKKFNHLSRKANHRAAMLSNMACSLIMHKRISTTLAKAKTELFQNVGEKIANRPGGYTRILRTGFRLGDAAEMAIIELVDYNENMLKETKKATKKATRRAGKKAVKEAVEEVAAEASAAAPEAPAAE